jgi:protein MpaA
MSHSKQKKSSNNYFNPCWLKTSLESPVSLSAQTELSELKNPILLIGGVHGDEPEGVHLAEQTLKWLCAQDQIQLVDWVVIPCLNVDGFLKQQRVNGSGVDLNRNYPSNDWSPEFAKDRYFPGTAPATEPEVQGIVSLIEKLKPRLLIHCHSWEPCIVYTGESGLKDSERLARSSGYKMIPDIGYQTPGSLGQFGCFDKSTPVICIEEQEQLKDFSPIWPRFSTAMKEIFTDFSERK